MPKQKIHEGSVFHLRPFEGLTPVGDDGGETMEIIQGYPTLPIAENVVVDRAPSLSLTWSKGGAADDPGIVYAEVEFTVESLRRMLVEYESRGLKVDEPIRIFVGPLSWRDLNTLAKTARDARDGAFGKPE